LTSLPLIARVALPVALPHTLQYRVPDALATQLRAGQRVRVPLRGREAFGIVTSLSREAPDGRPLRSILAIDPEAILLDAQLLELVTWMAHYYAAPPGMAMETAVPRAVVRPPRTSTRPAEEAAPEVEPPPTASQPLPLNPHQAAALEPVVAALRRGSGETFLLQGVTGSGKTEVYLQAIAATLALGKGALVLVPEIAVGTQVLARLRERFAERIAEYHSQLRPSARRQAWWDAWSGRAAIVVGARSAVFVPVRNLGLVVVDEEHEPAYKQSEIPRYHGRDTALMRARLARAVTLLGSATPSLESRTHAAQGKYVRLVLPERIAARPTPLVTLADLRLHPPAVGETGGLAVVGSATRDPGDPFSPYLLERLRATIAAGDQAILFLNRRGYATAVQCDHCGYVFECARCSVVLIYHRPEHELRCHYCNYRLAEVARCPECGGSEFAYTGAGTQKVEAALAHHVPQARILRMDLDSTRKRGALATLIRTFECGEADVLLGTQMVAKGFDFPHVTLVGVISADREMGLPDFRAQERAFQLLTQVAGRAGRGEKPGEVVFQTYMPDHHVIVAAGLQDYELFYERELAERRALRYPPLRRMASLLFDGPQEPAVVRAATGVAARLAGRSGLELLGPAPMPLSRLKGQFRWHLTLAAPRAGTLTRVIHEVLADFRTAQPPVRVRLQADVDPVSLL
jgi:primosomal protein N' (replication factor Y)